MLLSGSRSTRCSGGWFGVPDNKQVVLVGTACCHRYLVSQWVLNQLNVQNDALRDTFNDRRLPLRCRPNGDKKCRHLAATFMSETVSAQQRETSPKLATFLTATCMSLDEWNGPLVVSWTYFNYSSLFFYGRVLHGFHHEQSVSWAYSLIVYQYMYNL